MGRENVADFLNSAGGFYVGEWTDVSHEKGNRNGLKLFLIAVVFPIVIVFIAVSMGISWKLDIALFLTPCFAPYKRRICSG